MAVEVLLLVLGSTLWAELKALALMNSTTAASASPPASYSSAAACRIRSMHRRVVLAFGRRGGVVRLPAAL